MTELSAMKATWLDHARTEIGTAALGEGESNSRVEEYHRTVSQRPWDDKIPWCSSFLNWCMQRSGLPGTQSALARSWLDWGVPLENPRVGCVVVLWRDDPGSEKGHVGLFLREDAQHVYLLGGNQLGAVREHFYSKAMVLGYRWPAAMTGLDRPEPMKVDIVTFPRTRVAAVEHRGAPELEHETVRQLVAWKREQRLADPAKHRMYGLHHADPRTSSPSEYRAEFGISVDQDVGANDHGVYEMEIPEFRCAVARDIGSREDNQAAKYLFEQWLPASGETWTGYPAIFHYVNVGPNVKPQEAITDVYLPLR